jgi:hypothetical protein
MGMCPLHSVSAERSRENKKMLRSLGTNLMFFLRQSAALIGYLAMSYLVAMLLVAILFAVLESGGNIGFVIIGLFGFLSVGLFFSIPVLLIVAGVVLVMQKYILNHLAAWAFIAPFLVAAIFLASSYWLHPAFAQMTWLAYVQLPQIWIYAVFAFMWSAVASALFYVLVRRSIWI